MRNVVCKLLNAADKLPNSCPCQHLHRKPHSSTSFPRLSFQAPILKPGRCLGPAGQPARGRQREHHQAAAAAAARKTYHTITVLLTYWARPSLEYVELFGGSREYPYETRGLKRLARTQQTSSLAHKTGCFKKTRQADIMDVFIPPRRVLAAVLWNKPQPCCGTGHRFDPRSKANFFKGQILAGPLLHHGPPHAFASFHHILALDASWTQASTRRDMPQKQWTEQALLAILWTWAVTKIIQTKDRSGAGSSPQHNASNGVPLSIDQGCRMSSTKRPRLARLCGKTAGLFRDMARLCLALLHHDASKWLQIHSQLLFPKPQTQKLKPHTQPIPV